MSAPIRVKVYEVNQDTGCETFLHYSLVCDIEDITESERYELWERGRVWIGGGAAPLFYLVGCQS